MADEEPVGHKEPEQMKGQGEISGGCRRLIMKTYYETLRVQLVNGDDGIGIGKSMSRLVYERYPPYFWVSSGREGGLC